MAGICESTTPSGYSREFWLANLMELCERAAYYGFFIVLTLYLTDIIGFSDKETGVVAGTFFAGLYLLPPFVGAISDRIGFKNGLILAFGLLSLGYSLLGICGAMHDKDGAALLKSCLGGFLTLPITKGCLIGKLSAVLFLAIVMVGGSFIKPLITGTVAKTTTEANRARGFALFYWIVNVGAFGGKTFVPFIRQGCGTAYVNFFSALMALLALLVAAVLFSDVDRDGQKKKVAADPFRALGAIFNAPRLVILTIITAGFWIIQHQLYATMPKYVIRLVGKEARPEWLANVNPLVVVLCVVFVTKFMSRYSAVTSMLMGMAMMPFSALCMSFGPQLESVAGPSVSPLGGMHPFTVMMIVGIAIQGFAECFISPRFLEYFSLQAPKGQEGLYLGFSHLHSFISALAGFFMSGFLLDAYCPDPEKLPAGLTAVQKAAYYDQAHHIWYYFAGIGLIAAVAMWVFRSVTNRLDELASAGQSNRLDHRG